MDLNAIYKPKKFEEILLQTKILLFSLIVFVHQASLAVMVPKYHCFFSNCLYPMS